MYCHWIRTNQEYAVGWPSPPGEYTLVPQSGGLTGNSPDPGLLHDRLESLPPVLVTRPVGPHSAFYGLVDLETDIAWVERDR